MSKFAAVLEERIAPEILEHVTLIEAENADAARDKLLAEIAAGFTPPGTTYRITAIVELPPLAIPEITLVAVEA